MVESWVFLRRRRASSRTRPVMSVNVAAASDGGFEALAVLQSSSLEAGEIHLGAVDGPRLTVLELPYSLG